MKNTNLKNTMLSTAIAVALGFSVTQLQASDGQAAGQAIDPSNSPAPGQVRQPADGRELVDEVNPASVVENHRDMNHDPVDAEDFVETASAKTIAEIEKAQLALQEGNQAVQRYANRIIADHTAAKNDLEALAEQADVEVADDATLMDRAKEFVLSVRDGADFDEAYVDNQIAAHEESIELFERAAQSDNPEISAYASARLPTLQEHLRMANALKTQVSSL